MFLLLDYIFYILYLVFYVVFKTIVYCVVNFKIPRVDFIAENFVFMNFGLNHVYFRTVIGRIGKVIKIKSADDKKTYECLNFGSYDYLGLSMQEKINTTNDIFSATNDKSKFDENINNIKSKIRSLYKKNNVFLTSTGYAANASFLNYVITSRTKPLIIFSHKHNHASIVEGVTKSKYHALKVSIDVNEIEKELSPKYDFLIIVEGLFSASGCIENFMDIIELIRKYSKTCNIILFVDEAHSFGNVGKSGLGTFDFYNNTHVLNEVDIFIGTFSKSFNLYGGFAAVNQNIFEELTKFECDNYDCFVTEFNQNNAIFANILLNSMNFVFSDQGDVERKKLYDVSVYMHDRLKYFGFKTKNTRGSPMICFDLGSVPYSFWISNNLLKRNIAVTLVGHPVASGYNYAIRLCMSAYHTFDDVDYFVKHLYDVSNFINSQRNEKFIIQEYVNETNEIDLITTSSNPVKTALECYGTGNSGPRGYYANLLFFQKLEKLLCDLFGLSSGIIMSSTEQGCLSAIDHLSKKYTKVVILSNKVKSMMNKYKLPKNVFYDVSDSSIGHKYHEILIIHETNFQSMFHTAKVVDKEYFDQIKSFNKSRIENVNEKYILALLPEQGLFFGNKHSNLFPDCIKIRNFIYTATPSVHVFSNLFAKLNKKSIYN